MFDNTHVYPERLMGFGCLYPPDNSGIFHSTGKRYISARSVPLLGTVCLQSNRGSTLKSYLDSVRVYPLLGVEYEWMTAWKLTQYTQLYACIMSFN